MRTLLVVVTCAAAMAKLRVFIENAGYPYRGEMIYNNAARFLRLDASGN